MRMVSATLSLILLLIGLVGITGSLFGMFDPIGAKMSDDSDPFGTTPSLLSSVLMLLVYLAIGVAGGLLARKSFRKPVY